MDVLGCIQQDLKYFKSIRMLKKNLLILLLLQSVLFYVHAASVLNLNIEQLTNDASVVFNGRCISNQVEFDSTTNFVVTYTTFEILESIKGTSSLTHTIKQIGGNLPDRELQTNWPGVPSFIVGNEYVVFLPPVSKLGFSTPVGMDQGKFNVLTDTIDKQVNNGQNFDNLMNKVSVNIIPTAILNRMKTPGAAQKSTPSLTNVEPKKLNLDELLSVVRSIEAAK